MLYCPICLEIVSSEKVWTFNIIYNITVFNAHVLSREERKQRKFISTDRLSFFAEI